MSQTPEAIRRRLESYAQDMSKLFRSGSDIVGRLADNLSKDIDALGLVEQSALATAGKVAAGTATVARLAIVTESRISDMLASVLSIPGVERVWAHDKGIQILTGRLCATDPRTGRTHLIANHMILELPVVGSTLTKDIRMYNLTLNIIGVSGNQHAPHALSSGQPCLGNAGEIMMEAIEAGSLPSLVYIILEFLTTAYVADPAGRNVALFPIIQANGSLAIVSHKPLIQPNRLPGRLIDQIPELESKYLRDGLSLDEWTATWHSMPIVPLPKKVPVHSDVLHDSPIN